jgi:ABC-type nitrate/sulfonate/bicarbonate transport system permease component
MSRQRDSQRLSAPPAVGSGSAASPRATSRWWKRSSTWDWALRVITLVVFLGGWEYYARGVSPVLLVPPSAIAEEAWRLIFVENEILPAAITTLTALLLGFVIAAALGVAVGVLMGRFRILERIIDPYVSFIYAIPSIVFVPLILVWLGLGLKLRVFLVFLAGVFPVVINTMVGVKQVPADITDVGRVFCARERDALTTIVFPSALPYIFVGLRQALAQSLVMVVVAEMLVAITGLGGLMVTYGNFFHTASLFVPLLVIVATSLFLTWLIRWTGERLAPWAAAEGKRA